MATVQFVDRGDGIEVRLGVAGRIVSTKVVLSPELAADLAVALAEHAEDAERLSGAPA